MNNEYILITGASSGIGLELAKKYAEKGEKLILVARRKEILEGFKAIYPETIVISLDLCDIENSKKLYNMTKEKGLYIKFLINNAGFGEFGNFIDTDLEKEINMINLNILTLTILTKLYLKDMIKKNSGRILNVSSIASFVPGPKMSVYYATKAFVTSFTEAIRYELRNTDIQISSLCPGPTKTGFIKSSNLEGVSIFGNKTIDTPEKVSKYTIENIDKNIIIPGWKNKLLVFITRFTPRWLILFVVNKLQSRKEN